MILVAVERSEQHCGPLLLEDCYNSFDMGLEMEWSLFEPNEGGKATLTTLIQVDLLERYQDI